MSKLLIIIVLAIIVILSGGNGFADTMSQELLEKINNTDISDKIGVLIIVKSAEFPSTLRKELIQKYKTNAERHYVGINRLKTASVQSQKSVLEKLTDLETKGLSSSTKGHWLINGITTKISISELESISGHPDIVSIQTIPKIESIIKEQSANTEGANSISSLSLAAGVQPNLEVVGAPEAWALGQTGKGSIICSFDTGVDGLHPALFSNWKGHDGDSSAAWYDPYGQQPFPHSLPEAGEFLMQHGTHTMGIMVGHDDNTGDTIGVAPDAKWISAAVIDLPYVSIIDAFEWAADPDGDPNTFDDVPDVINHSWGTANELVGCDDFLWELVDNTEALGIVNIFAAGNAGSLLQTIANPANRANDSIDCFAVGAFNHLTTSENKIVSSSSRGPSDCDGISIKPNVVAPGIAVISSIPDGELTGMTGTSMAAPHVSGAVAILRQYAPNSTPAQIKEALLVSCVPYPDAGSSPNNNYGWGMINIPAAITYLTPTFESDLRISSFGGSLTNSGETVSGDLAVTNMGQTVSNVSGNSISWDAGLTAVTPTVYFGDIDSGQIVLGDIQFQATVDDAVSSGQILSIDMTLSGDGGYSKNVKIFIRIGETDGLGKPGFYSHETGAISFTITDFGQYGFGLNSFIPLGQTGFSFNGIGNQLFEASFMIGVDAEHVSDGARNFKENSDNDFAVISGGELVFSEPGQNADQETVSTFNDSFAENPLDLEIQQKTYSWNSYPDSNYVIMEYSIRNNGDTSLNNIYAGLFFDWDIVTYSNCGGYSADENLGYMYYLYGFDDDSNYRGLVVINPEGVASYRLRDNAFSEYYIWPESDKYAALSEGLVDITNTSKVDLAQILSTGPYNLGTGQSDTAVFAVVAANNLDGLKLAALEANDKYYAATDIQYSENDQLPDNYYLFQNHPNPFNPSTTISFSLKNRQNVLLSVYNILGEKVVDLIEEKLPAGFHSITWDGSDNNAQVASGIYFYRLSVENSSYSRKMVLLK